MQRWKLTLAYDGTSFHGWQVQPRLPTVQGTLAAALRKLTGESPLPQGSGRTDAGVHALAQVASFDLAAPIPPPNLQRALNRTLPPSIRILSAEHAHPTFHARHSATAKTYEYRIFPRLPVARPSATAQPSQVTGSEQDRICPPTLASYIWDCPWHFSLTLANEAAHHILGEHDFTSFAAVEPDLATRGTGAEPTAIRTIHHSCWSQHDGNLIYRVTGSGFLHHMVRNLVGTFVEAAAARLSPASIPHILAARNRSAAGPTAPARGLFLVSVDYPILPGAPHLASEMWEEPPQDLGAGTAPGAPHLASEMWEEPPQDLGAGTGAGAPHLASEMWDKAPQDLGAGTGAGAPHLASEMWDEASTISKADS